MIVQLMASIAVLTVLFSSAKVWGEHSPAEKERLVADLLSRTMEHRDVIVLGRSFVRPDYSNPDVFYNIRTETPWTRAEKEAAFQEFVANMGQIDFTESRWGRPDVLAATLQCLRFNYTNAVPSIQRVILNPAIDSTARGLMLEYCIELSPVDDGMTSFMGNVVTNSLFTKWQRRYVVDYYANKVYGAMVSNLTAHAVCDRAALMIYNKYPRDDWAYVQALDHFFSNYFEGYAVSSNRLAYLEGVLSNTNVTENANMIFIKKRFISLTNQLHEAEQPLRQITIGEGGCE